MRSVLPRLSDHAIERCVQRDISLADVYTVIMHPIVTAPSKDGTLVKYYDANGICVRVDPRANRIVTVFDHSQPHDYRLEMGA